MKKLTSTNNTKTLKGLARGYQTLILNLAPSTLSGFNTCPKASPDCRRECLNLSGLAKFENVQKARVEKTLLYYLNPVEFKKKLYKEIEAFAKKCERENLTPCIRLNGTSDIPKLAIEVAKDFPTIQFYDYTKILKTLRRLDLPVNYHLTFSRSESNWSECLEALELGFQVAVVAESGISDSELLEALQLRPDVPIVNGDEDDLTFLKPKGAILRLAPKGRAKTSLSDFVIRKRETQDKYWAVL